MYNYHLKKQPAHTFYCIAFISVLLVKIHDELGFVGVYSTNNSLLHLVEAEGEKLQLLHQDSSL